MNSSLQISQIPLRNLGDEPYEVSCECTAQDLHLLGDEDVYLGRLYLDGNLILAGTDICAQMEVLVDEKIQCSRCLEEVCKKKKIEISFDKTINKNDRYLDLTPNLREELILGRSVHELCSLECKGLCAQCGQNLNKNICQCNAETSQKN